MEAKKGNKANPTPISIQSSLLAKQDQQLKEMGVKVGPEDTVSRSQIEEGGDRLTKRLKSRSQAHEEKEMSTFKGDQRRVWDGVTPLPRA